jgi:predicted 3-demethylubiquinone-9 3-methyltransferase (glyoxalase superfamily)
MPKTIPCLWFDHNAEEAANYYISVFPNSRMGTILRYPEDNPFPGDFAPGTVLTVEFELDGQPYTALNGGPLFTFSEAISFQIYCKDQDEIDYYWNTLTSDGGKESQCGWLKDKFGLSWQVVPEDLGRWTTATDPAKAAAVMAAVAGMKKLDLETLRQAAGDG